MIKIKYDPCPHLQAPLQWARSLTLGPSHTWCSPSSSATFSTVLCEECSSPIHHFQACRPEWVHDHKQPEDEKLLVHHYAFDASSLIFCPLGSMKTGCGHSSRIRRRLLRPKRVCKPSAPPAILKSGSVPFLANDPLAEILIPLLEFWRYYSKPIYHYKAYIQGYSMVLV